MEDYSENNTAEREILSVTEINKTANDFLNEPVFDFNDEFDGNLMMVVMMKFKTPPSSSSPRSAAYRHACQYT